MSQQRDLLENRICRQCADDPSIVDRNVCEHSPLLVNDPLLGTTIANRYKITAVTGIGGWSTVYSAEDTKLNRQVAVKILHLHLCVDPEKLQRFQREAQAASSIVHNNVAVMHDCGFTSTGRPYITMELVEGKSLAHVIRKGRSIPEYIEIFKQVCDGLQAIHKMAVIHRDLKPNNIVISNDGVAKVLDFGSAKWTLQDEVLTKTDEAVGTPCYMSPEQCLGQKLDARSDIYSLGCMVYEAITGLKPFAAETALASMQLQLKSMPARMRTTKQTGAPVPPKLETLVFKALAKNPQDRFNSIAEFKSALENCQKADGLFSSIVPRVAWQRMSARQRRLSIASLIAAPLLTIMLLAFLPQPTKQRTLLFPVGRPVGTLYLVSNDNGKIVKSRLAPAEGAVHVDINARVNLSEVPKKDGNLSFLSKLKPDALDSLDLFVSPMSDATIAQINWLSGLNTLSLGRCDVTDKQLNSLNLPNLTGLNLSDTKISDVGLANIEKRFPKLRWISLRGNESVTDAGIQSVAGLAHLNTLSMDDTTKVTDECLISLGACQTLRTLDLNSDNITDRGVSALAKADRLFGLDLGSTHITNEGVEKLSSTQNLHNLNLSQTALTDLAVNSLARMKQLKNLSLTSTSISKEKLSELRVALPKCSIESD
jgi:tRNA A-37 threonylcarbamoyl transferase component Bud32